MLLRRLDLLIRHATWSCTCHKTARTNQYFLVGNDPEQDPDREPEPPTRAIDKPVQRAGKRNTGAEGPGEGGARPRGGGRGGRHDAFTGSEQGMASLLRLQIIAAISCVLRGCSRTVWCQAEVQCADNEPLQHSAIAVQVATTTVAELLMMAFVKIGIPIV